jgi:hypothetical protein
MFPFTKQHTIVGKKIRVTAIKEAGLDNFLSTRFFHPKKLDKGEDATCSYLNLNVFARFCFN